MNDKKNNKPKFVAVRFKQRVDNATNIFVCVFLSDRAELFSCIFSKRRSRKKTLAENFSLI